MMKNNKHILEHSGVPHVYSGKGKYPGKTVTVLGGMHGNEKAGIQVVKTLLEQRKEIHSGILQVAMGNPRAIKEDKRFIKKDLNRCFGEMNNGKTYEEARARELMPYLKRTDILLDIHSTLKPSQPFIAIPNTKAFHEYKDLVATLGIKTIITGEGLWPANGDHIYADTFVEAQSGFGMTIEAGWIEDPKTRKIIHGIHAALHHLNIFEGSYTSAPKQQELEVWHATKNIVAPPGFTFKKNGKPYDWSNFEKIPEGTVYATANEQEFTTDKDQWIIFPKRQIITGDEVCILAEKLNL